MNTEANFQTPTENGQPQAVVKAPEKPKAAKKPKLFTRQNAPFLAAGGTLFLVSLIILFSPNIEWLDGREQVKLDIDAAERVVAQYQEDWNTTNTEKTDLQAEKEAELKKIEDKYNPKIEAKDEKLKEIEEKANDKREEIQEMYGSLDGNEVVGVTTYISEPSFQ